MLKTFENFLFIRELELDKAPKIEKSNGKAISMVPLIP